ncbi:MAG: hypothetical protein K6F37_01625 [Lachnospiraceae bacterium]|nr:hypothetical protein [Lachnospiraceae bacterium]
MADYSEDLKYLDEMYNSTKTVANKKNEKDTEADVTDEKNDLEGISMAYSILDESGVLAKSGMTRDVSDIDKGSEIFPKLENMLDRSGRSSSSKYIHPVANALKDYLSPYSVNVRTEAFFHARTTEGADKNEAMNRAAAEAFTDITAQVKQKMNDFITAANEFIEEHDNTTRSWSAAGKQRRAMIRAAAQQMKDQLKEFDDKSEFLRDNVRALLEAADSERMQRLSLSAHGLVKELLTEESKKWEAFEVDILAKEITKRIGADESISGRRNEVNDFEKTASVLNMGKTDREKSEFDISMIYREYLELRQKYPQNFGSSGFGLMQTKPDADKAFFEDTLELRKQKANISAMFYLMTGQNRLPEFIYFWQEMPFNPSRGIYRGTYCPVRAYPLTVPEIVLGNEVNAADFVDQIKSTFGQDSLENLDFMKYAGGVATNQANLEKEDDAIWKDLAKSFSNKTKEEETTTVGLDKAKTIQLRYLALQKALGARIHDAH